MMCGEYIHMKCIYMESGYQLKACCILNLPYLGLEMIPYLGLEMIPDLGLEMSLCNTKPINVFMFSQPIIPKIINLFQDLSNPSLINIINLTEIAIRRLIKMSKRISAFKSLCQEDQIALLKGGCTEMMILRSVCAYDPDKDSWKVCVFIIKTLFMYQCYVQTVPNIERKLMRIVLHKTLCCE